MEVLYFFESIRNPVLDVLVRAVTELGGAVLFILFGMLMFWCVDKRQGYFLLSVGLAGTFLNQFLKISCRVPRPWVRDPQFTIVESARAGATGYSFPSGHSQTAVGVYGGLALCRRERWVRVTGILLAILIPLSRMYLGVHTPADVLVGGLCALVLIFLLWPLFARYGTAPRLMVPVLAGTAALGLLLLGYVNLYDFPADLELDSYNEAVKNAWSLLGVTLGLVVAWLVDEYKLHFSTKAPLWGQALKLGVGLLLLVALLEGTKPLWSLLLGDAAWAPFPRYLVTTLFAGVAWPATFRFFDRYSAKNKT